MSEELLNTDQYLTFALAGETYGVGIERVREVLEFAVISPVPSTPEYVKGVFNLRGNIVPVLDLKQKFGLGKTKKTVSTCIVIVEVNVFGDQLVVGFLADSVSEVFDIDRDTIEPPPSMGGKIQTDYIEGIGKTDELFIVILDIDKVFSEGFEDLP